MVSGANSSVPLLVQRRVPKLQRIKGAQLDDGSVRPALETVKDCLRAVQLDRVVWRWRDGQLLLRVHCHFFAARFSEIPS